MELPSLEYVDDLRRAGVLLQPLRLRLLSLARRPASATELARTLGLSRQKVNYHVSALAGAGFLRPAGTRRRRNLTERRYQASAWSYVLHPSLLGPVAATQLRESGETASATSSTVVRVLAELAGLTGDRLAFSQLSRLAFAEPASREAFRRALGVAMVDAVRQHAAEAATPGRPLAAERWRLMLALYPITDAGSPPESGGSS